MRKAVKIIDFYQCKSKKGDRMCKELLKKIRERSNDIKDMPERAQDVLDFFKIEDFSSGVPIVEILTKMGFKIFQSDLEPDGLSAYIAVDPKYEEVFGSNKITCVHINDNIGHKKFALAHELGHYLFDFNEGEDLYYYDTYFPTQDSDKLEEQRANKFAANLLMPEKKFREEFQKYQQLQSKADIVTALSRYFFVSSTAILKRFQELNIKGFEDNTGVK